MVRALGLAATGGDVYRVIERVVETIEVNLEMRDYINNDGSRHVSGIDDLLLLSSWPIFQILNRVRGYRYFDYNARISTDHHKMIHDDHYDGLDEMGVKKNTNTDGDDGVNGTENVKSTSDEVNTVKTQTVTSDNDKLRISSIYDVTKRHPIDDGDDDEQNYLRRLLFKSLSLRRIANEEYNNYDKITIIDDDDSNINDMILVYYPSHRLRLFFMFLQHYESLQLLNRLWIIPDGEEVEKYCKMTVKKLFSVHMDGRRRGSDNSNIRSHNNIVISDDDDDDGNNDSFDEDVSPYYSNICLPVIAGPVNRAISKYRYIIAATKAIIMENHYLKDIEHIPTLNSNDNDDDGKNEERLGYDANDNKGDDDKLSSTSVIGSVLYLTFEVVPLLSPFQHLRNIVTKKEMDKTKILSSIKKNDHDPSLLSHQRQRGSPSSSKKSSSSSRKGAIAATPSSRTVSSLFAEEYFNNDIKNSFLYLLVKDASDCYRGIYHSNGCSVDDDLLYLRSLLSWHLSTPFALESSGILLFLISFRMDK